MAATHVLESPRRGKTAPAAQQRAAAPLDTARELAAAALEDTTDDIDAAAAALSRKLLASPDLMREHLATVVEQWCRDQVRAVLRARRESIIKSASVARSSPGLAEAMSNELRRFMDMPIYGGKPIRNATPAEVRESASSYKIASRSMALQSRWQEAVAAAAEKNGPVDAPIGSTLSEATLAKLWEEANAH